MGKKRTRIKQTKTDFQRTFGSHEVMIQSTSWLDVAPEVIHIALALQNNSFEEVQRDFNIICDATIEHGYTDDTKFSFTLSQAVLIIKNNIKFLELLKNTAFDSLREIICIYHELFEIPISCAESYNIMPMAQAFNSILDGRSDTSILCKQLMIRRFIIDGPLPIGLQSTTIEEILLPQNVSSIMAIFPITVRASNQMSVDFCEDIWYFNYFRMPFARVKNVTKSEEEKFREHRIALYRQRLIRGFDDFKQIPLLAIFPRGIAEVIKGCCARVANLSIDIIGLVETHKGEIADIVLRSVLETQFQLLWLLIEDKSEHYQRFREFSIGKEKFMGYKLAKMAGDIEVVSKTGKEIAADAVKESGMRDELVAEERGDAFEVNISQMTDRIWGKENMQYFNYKRLSETIHGHWRTIEKYHLERSINPMQQGLLDYKSFKQSYNGLTPAFAAMITTLDTLIAVLDLIDHPSANSLKESLKTLWISVNEEHLQYIGLDPSLLKPQVN